MLSQIKSTAIISMCAAMLSASCGTEAQNAPAMFSVLTIEVKPGTNGAFEEFIGKFRAAAEQTSSLLRWTASSSLSGNAIYTFSRPFGSFNELGTDAGPPLNEVYGAEEGGRLLGLLQASAASMSTSIYVERPDLSRPAPEAEAPPAAVLYIDITVRIGGEQRFEDYAKKVIEATNATAPDAHWLMRQRVFGPGNAASYRVIVLMPQWADLDTPDKPIPQRMQEHFGAAEAERLQAALGDAIQGINDRVNRVRTDLARPPIAD